MASRGIALVNRLRLGEAPAAADAVLAARLLALSAEAAVFVDIADDLVATCASDPTARKLRVRLGLTAETSRQMEHAAEATLSALARYFALRADVDSSDEADGDGGGDGDGGAGTRPASEPVGVAAALADLAVPARTGEAIESALLAVRDACNRVLAGLNELLAKEPDTEAALDFLSTLEADLQGALYDALRPDYAEGERPYRPGLADACAESLAPR